jgi:hypothetical protein
MVPELTKLGLTTRAEDKTNEALCRLPPTPGFVDVPAADV